MKRLLVLRAQLYALWRRAVYCRRGLHREAVHPDPLLLSWRCVDCGCQRVIGLVFRDSNHQRQPHHPWERPDA